MHKFLYKEETHTQSAQITSKGDPHPPLFYSGKTDKKRKSYSILLIISIYADSFSSSITISLLVFFCVCFFSQCGISSIQLWLYLQLPGKTLEKARKNKVPDFRPFRPRCSMSVFPKQSCLLCSFTFLFCSINHRRRRCLVEGSARWSSPSLLPRCNSPAAKLVMAFRAGGPSPMAVPRKSYTNTHADLPTPLLGRALAGSVTKLGRWVLRALCDGPLYPSHCVCFHSSSSKANFLCSSLP